MKRLLFVSLTFAALVCAGISLERVSPPTSSAANAQGLPTFASPQPTDLIRVVSGGLSGYASLQQTLTPSRWSCSTSTDCTLTSGNLNSQPFALGSVALTGSTGTFTGLVKATGGVQPNPASTLTPGPGYAPEALPSVGAATPFPTHPIIVFFVGASTTSAGTANTIPNGIAFTGTTTYNCTANSTASTAAIEVSNTSGTVVTEISSAGSPATSTICIGY